MVVRLQKADGEVKRFPTTYSEGERESGIPEKWRQFPKFGSNDARLLFSTNGPCRSMD